MGYPPRFSGSDEEIAKKYITHTFLNFSSSEYDMNSDYSKHESQPLIQQIVGQVNEHISRSGLGIPPWAPQNIANSYKEYTRGKLKVDETPNGFIDWWIESMPENQRRTLVDLLKNK